MTHNELRALADALSRQRQADEHGIYCAVPRQAVDAAIRHLRACADAQPVAWRDHVEQRIRGWRQRTMNRSGDRLALDDMMGQESIDDLIDYVCDEWAAPTAPHHAMLDSHRRLVEQAIQSAEHPSGMSTHDGKARIDASILRRMLAIIDSSPATPQEK